MKILSRFAIFLAGIHGLIAIWYLEGNIENCNSAQDLILFGPGFVIGGTFLMIASLVVCGFILFVLPMWTATTVWKYAFPSKD